MATRGCFVTGTDTGAGKTILAAALCAAMRAAGVEVAAFKPVVTGVEDEAAAAGQGGTARATAAGAAAGGATAGGEPEAVWPADHELLAAVTGAQPGDVTTRTFAPAVSPHLAAELAGSAIEHDALVAAAAAAAARCDVLVVEGVGGLLVPLGEGHDVRDLAVALGLPLVIAARPGLGTINHSLLTIDAARAAGLDVRAVVLTPWPDEPTVMQRSNLDTIARLGRVEVAVLAHVADAGGLAAAGAGLPWASWCGVVGSTRP